MSRRDDYDHWNEENYYDAGRAESFQQMWGSIGTQFLRNRKATQQNQIARGQEIRWGNSATLPFTFTGNGSQTADVAQLLQVDSESKVWSLNLALTMVQPTEMPAGDAVAAFFVINVGVGSSRIVFRRLIDNAAFAPIPVIPFAGLVQSTANLIVPDVPATQILVSCHTQYNNTHGAASLAIRVDAAASPVMR
jgi:hypothetical protein